MTCSIANSSNRLESQPDKLGNTKTLLLTFIEGYKNINYIDHIPDISLETALLIIYLYIFKVLKIALKLLELWPSLL